MRSAKSAPPVAGRQAALREPAPPGARARTNTTATAPRWRNACACGGGCARCATEPAAPPLALGAAGSEQERRADVMAERALGLRTRNFATDAVPARGGAVLQLGSTAVHAAVQAARDRAGQPLPTSTRELFEPRWQRDLGAVRIHTDAPAARSAQALHAQAWTLGQDVYFAQGRYAPGQVDGRGLLAHELAHTLENDRRTVRRRPSETADTPAAPADEPVEMPTDITEETLRLAGATAERIDDVVTSDWALATQRGSQAMMLAAKVERLLSDVFERGYSWTDPQLRDKDAPVLQYFVAQHPGLRDRLAVLRRLAGDRNTERIGRYLDITPGSAKAFSYQLWMGGGSGGRVIEGMLQWVRIRYLEEGQPVWTREYAYVAVGVAIPPGKKVEGGVSGDADWNSFYAGEYWAPEDFVGTMGLLSASAGGAPKGRPGPGVEIEGALIYGDGQHEPIAADIGGTIVTTPDVGAGGFLGRLIPLHSSPAPDPGHGVLPPAPPYVQRPDVVDQMIVGFATGDTQLDDGDLIELAAFVGRWRDVFDGGFYELQLIGYASRTGSAELNQRLSDQRVAAVRSALQDYVGAAWDDNKITAAAVGEEWARLVGRDPDDNSASDRIVEVSLVGKQERPVEVK